MSGYMVGDIDMDLFQFLQYCFRTVCKYQLIYLMAICTDFQNYTQLTKDEVFDEPMSFRTVDGGRTHAAVLPRYNAPLNTVCDMIQTLQLAQELKLDMRLKYRQTAKAKIFGGEGWHSANMYRYRLLSIFAFYAAKPRYIHPLSWIPQKNYTKYTPTPKETTLLKDSILLERVFSLGDRQKELLFVKKYSKLKNDQNFFFHKNDKADAVNKKKQKYGYNEDNDNKIYENRTNPPTPNKISTNPPTPHNNVFDLDFDDDDEDSDFDDVKFDVNVNFKENGDLKTPQKETKKKKMVPTYSEIKVDEEKIDKKSMMKIMPCINKDYPKYLKWILHQLRLEFCEVKLNNNLVESGTFHGVMANENQNHLMGLFDFNKAPTSVELITVRQTLLSINYNDINLQHWLDPKNEQKKLKMVNGDTHHKDLRIIDNLKTITDNMRKLPQDFFNEYPQLSNGCYVIPPYEKKVRQDILKEVKKTTIFSGQKGRYSFPNSMKWKLILWMREHATTRGNYEFADLIQLAKEFNNKYSLQRLFSAAGYYGFHLCHHDIHKVFKSDKK